MFTFLLVDFVGNTLFSPFGRSAASDSNGKQQDDSTLKRQKFSTICRNNEALRSCGVRLKALGRKRGGIG